MKHEMSRNWLDRLMTIEGMSASSALAWGVWLLVPEWDSFSVSPTYREMAEHAPEWAWGLWLALLGLGALLCILGRQPRPMPFFMMFLSASWAFIATMFAMADLSSTAIPMYATMFMFTLGCLVRHYTNGYLRATT